MQQHILAASRGAPSSKKKHRPLVTDPQRMSKRNSELKCNHPPKTLKHHNPQSTHNFPESLALSPPQLSLKATAHAKAVRRSNKIRDSLHRRPSAAPSPTTTTEAGDSAVSNASNWSAPQRRPANDPPPLSPAALYCHRCRRVKPPRAHHCRRCGTCVLKMDHHCPWVGGCVARTINASFSSSYSGSPCSRSTPHLHRHLFPPRGSIA